MGLLNKMNARREEKMKINEWRYIEYLEERIAKLKNRNAEIYNWSCKLQNENYEMKKELEQCKKLK